MRNSSVIGNEKCDHCFHIKRGPIHAVIPDGHVVQECCKCHTTRTTHVEHALKDKIR